MFGHIQNCIYYPDKGDNCGSNVFHEASVNAGDSDSHSHGLIGGGHLEHEISDVFSPINSEDIPPEVSDPIASADKIFVSLDDDDDVPHRLDAYNRWVERKERKKRNAPKVERRWKIWSYFRPFVVIICSLAIALFLAYAVGSKFINKYLLPVDPNDPTPITITIPKGSGASSIAKILYEACGEDEPGLIPHKAVFKIYVDFIGKSSRLQAGTYILSKNMSIPEIVDVICKGNPPRPTVTITIAEGLTLDAIADKLVEYRLFESPDRFLELCKTGEAFVDEHPFVADIPVTNDKGESRQYALEGYLFPDTYDVYSDSSEEDIINKMLSRFEAIFIDDYDKRAKELGLSMDDVVILASLIEKEAKPFDFSKVSAVFKNRLSIDMPLGSDASLEYIFRTGELSLTQEQLSNPTPYNTHIYAGLPLGPVASPGVNAIKAALYPDEQYIAEEFLYFCLMDSDTGALVFAKTLSEHQKNIALYSPKW